MRFVPLLKLRDEVGPADVGHTQVLVVQTREANVHEYLAQAVVHCVQDEALCERAVGGRHGAASSCLKQLSGAAASEAFQVRRPHRPGGSRREQLSGGAKQRPVLEGGAVEAEGGVVVPRRDRGAAGRADGAEVQNALAPFAHGGHLPGFGQDVRGRLAGRGGGQVAVAFYGRLEGEVPVGAVLLRLVLVRLGVSRVLENRRVGDHAGVEESIIGAEEDGLLVQGVDQALFAPRAAALPLGRGSGSVAFNQETFRLLLYHHHEVFVLLGIHHHSRDVTLCHLSDIRACALQICSFSF